MSKKGTLTLGFGIQVQPRYPDSGTPILYFMESIIVCIRPSVTDQPEKVFICDSVKMTM